MDKLTAQLDEFEEELDQDHAFVIICGRFYPAGQALRKIDPEGFEEEMLKSRGEIK